VANIYALLGYYNIIILKMKVSKVKQFFSHLFMPVETLYSTQLNSTLLQHICSPEAELLNAQSSKSR